MSAFEFKLTPPRARPPKSTELREPTEVFMAPFSAKSIVQFEDVPVQKTARRVLRIVNPSEDELQVKVTKFVNSDHNITLSWTENMVPAQSEIEMEITWSPQMEIACKETMQLTDNRNFRKDIMIILKSQSNKPHKPLQNMRKYPTLSSGNKTHTRVHHLKSPATSSKSNKSHSQLQLRTRFQQPVKPQTTVDGVKPKWNTTVFKPPKVVLSQAKQACPPIEGHSAPSSSFVEYAADMKENVCPSTPKNVLHLIDNLKFTPVTETKARPTVSLDNLASLPTPTSAVYYCGDVPKIQPRCLAAANLWESNHVEPREIKTEVTFAVHSNTLVSSNNDETFAVKPNEIKTEEPLAINTSASSKSNETFEIKPSTSFETSLNIQHNFNHENNLNTSAALNRTTTIVGNSAGRELEMIQEEDVSSMVGCKSMVVLDKTYNCEAANMKRDINLVGTPLRKYAESMKDLSVQTSELKIAIQGSMPNLNEVENIRFFEQNRFLYRNAAPSRRRLSTVEEQSHETISTLKLKQEILDESEVIVNESRINANSHADFTFNQNEILAQSSRFNINEVGQKTSPISFNFKSDNQSKSKPGLPSKAGENVTGMSPTGCRQKRRSSELIDSPNKNVSLNAVANAGNKAGLIKMMSPPKRLRMDKECSRLKSSPVNTSKARTKTRPELVPKKFKTNRILTLSLSGKAPSSPEKTHNKPIVKLYDTDLYMQEWLNPDPFAATTTCDPFLSTTMYLDARAVDMHMKDFKKWLNALVTIPAELDTDCNAKVDVAQLFNEARHKDLTLAPTKEEQSLQYLTQGRLESLRRAAVNLYMSKELYVPCTKVAAHVSKNAIRIRQDRNLHLDMVLQRNVLELLLSFNPLWLRLGLEVVFCERIQLKSNNDVIGLSSFILNRLFRDKYLEQKYSKAYRHSEEYSEHIKRFTLLKIFPLLLFLDVAKSQRIIKHNPCLFVKKSLYKETKEVLLRFSAEMLASIGDITRELKRFGYVLQHKQTYLDEFDYAFNNLIVDLRDGVRLTRVMEIILLRDDLSKQLRVPAISRLQRIFNVGLAFKALKEADFVLKGEITPADIVDGCRDATLSLLWQIIYKFRSPKFQAAAAVLQSWWRHIWLRVVIRRRIRCKEELRRESAAFKIQALFHGYITRKQVKVYKAERTQAAIVVQKYIRCFMARREYVKRFKAVLYIQRWYRASRERIICRQSFLLLKECTLYLQCCYRRRLLARKLLLVAHEAQLYREAKQHAAAKCIQTNWRNYRETAELRRKFLQIRKSAVVVQSRYRAKKAMQSTRSYYLKLQQNALATQRCFRARKLMIEQREQFLHLRLCVIRMQKRRRALVKMRLVRQEYLKHKQLIIGLQRRVRAMLLMKQQRALFLKLRQATSSLQKRYRARLAMKSAVKHFTALKKSAIYLQRKWRATLLARRVQANYIKLQYYVTVVQQTFRGNKLMRVELARYKQIRTSCINIQRRYRAKLQMRRDRSNFLQLRCAAMVLQSRFRAKIAMRTARASYLRLKNAAICIQQHQRGLWLMRRQQAEYLQLQCHVLKMQRRFRANKLRNLLRQQFIYRRQMVIKLQRRLRATLLMRRTRSSYFEYRTAVINVQIRFRAQLAMHRVRKSYQAQRQAAVLLQTWYRSLLMGRKEQKSYQKMRDAGILIQRQWRARKAGLLQRQLYLKQRQGILCIQRKWRATLLMRAERLKYQQLRHAVVTVQRRYRARLDMLNLRNQYLLVRSLIIFLQRRFRAYKAMSAQRHEYQLLRRTTMHLQQKFRGRHMMKAERATFLLLRKSVADFQAHARGLLARKRFQALITPEMVERRRRQRAAKLLQRVWRGYCVRKRLRSQPLRQIRQNIKDSKLNWNEKSSVRYRVRDAVSTLKGRFSTLEILSVLTELERLSRHVPQLLMSQADFIATFCYGIMAQAIRSEIDKQLIENCSRIILNLSRYSSANTFQKNGLVTIAQMLLRWCDKDCGIFSTLCTLIWIFAHCPEKKKIIREFMITTEAIYMLRETKKLVARKENMKKNVRKPVIAPRNSELQTNFSRCTLPSLEPDYGVVRNRPYVFISSKFGFDSIIYKLDINLF